MQQKATHPGEIIASLRRRAGLSQQGLADRIFVTRQAVSRWEQGRSVPRPDMLHLLAELFSVPVTVFFGGDEARLMDGAAVYRSYTDRDELRSAQEDFPMSEQKKESPRRRLRRRPGQSHDPRAPASSRCQAGRRLR